MRELAVRPHVPSGSVTRSEGPKPEAWEAHRATITALYRQENLKTVQQIMDEDHGFQATSRMYKTRIRHWKLDKKRKAPEMLYARRIISERKATNKLTTVVIRAKELSEADVENYFKRQKVSGGRSQLIAEAAETPEAISCFTPPAILSPKLSENGAPVRVRSSCPSESSATSQPQLRAVSGIKRHASRAQPGQDRALHLRGAESLDRSDLLQLTSLSACELISLTFPENLLYNESALMELKTYFTSYFQSQAWVDWSDELLYRRHHTGSVLSSPYVGVDDPRNLVANFEEASRNYTTNCAGDAFAFIEAAFGTLKPLLYQEHPQLLSCLLLVLCVLTTANLPELPKEFLSYTNDLSRLVLGSSHPITRLSSWLAHSGEVEALTDRAFDCIRDMYKCQGGSKCRWHLDAPYIHLWSLFTRGKYEEAQTGFERLYEPYRTHPELGDYGINRIICSMVQILFAQGKTSAAEQLLCEMKDRLVALYGNSSQVEKVIYHVRSHSLSRRCWGCGIFGKLRRPEADFSEIPQGCRPCGALKWNSPRLSRM